MGMKQVYMVVGCPGSGKSWVCERVRDHFTYIPHDAHIGGNYVREIKRQAETATKPLLIETPFSMSIVEDPLKMAGFRVECIFIQEAPGVIEERYKAREGKPLPEAHLTRQRTYKARAIERNAFQGTSERVLGYLMHLAPNPPLLPIQKVYPWEMK